MPCPLTRKPKSQRTIWERAIDQAIAACDGDVRATIRALIVANNFLESEVGELMKAVSHAYARGRFQILFRLRGGQRRLPLVERI